ncbi:MAG: septum formation initiator family protein [bacterium]|nr:septum formation initiator family protein [bacterium]
MIQGIRKFKKGDSHQTIFFSALLILLFFLAIGFLIISNWRINQRRSELISQIGNLQEEIQVLEEKNQELKAGISQASSQSYLEEVARESFGLKKPGEEVAVILPPPEEEKEVKEEEKGVWERILEKLKFW